MKMEKRPFHISFGYIFVAAAIILFIAGLAVPLHSRNSAGMLDAQTVYSAAAQYLAAKPNMTFTSFGTYPAYGATPITAEHLRPSVGSLASSIRNIEIINGKLKSVTITENGRSFTWTQDGPTRYA